MLNQLAAYFNQMVTGFEKSTSYGSDLEKYIISKNPQNTYEVEYWTNQFDKIQNEQGRVS